MAFAGASAELTEEGREFLQKRVASAGLAGACGFGLFLLYRVIDGIAKGEPDLLEPSMVLHGVAILPLLGMWVLLRGGAHTARLVRVIAAAGLLGTTIAMVAEAQFIPLWNRPEMIVLSALTFGWTARAIYVPSSAQRTLVLTAIAGLPILAGTYFSFLKFDPETWAHVEPTLRSLTPEQVAQTVTINIGVWWALTTGLCTAASSVIYGLRKEVSDVKRLGQYTLVEKLGEGGMGMVYRASHAMLRRPTAIKLMLPEKAGRANLARFEREVQMTAQLSHPNTVRIHDYGRTPDGTFYYAMELLDGATLEQMIEVDGAQVSARVLYILEQITSALTEAHGIGLIHRDIKPSNIILCEQGGLPDVAKIVDFGLVKNIEAGAEGSLTNPEIVTGTPLYMPPEAIADPDSMDGRSDLYALGAVAYYLLTSTHVFEGNTLVEIFSHHLHTAPEPPAQRLGAPLPEDLQGLVLDCLAKDRNDRPRDASEMLERLRRCASSGEWREAQARKWWSRWRDEIQRAAASETTVPTGKTELKVDFATRAG